MRKHRKGEGGITSNLHPFGRFVARRAGVSYGYVSSLCYPGVMWLFFSQGNRQPVEHTQSYHMDQPARYRIRLHGYVSERRASSYGEMSAMVMTSADGQTETELTGLVTDQAALVGLINMLYDLGHAVVAVERIEPDKSDESDESDESDAPDTPKKGI